MVRGQSGFSLIELMTVLVIGGILLAVAIPSWTTSVKNNCLTTDTNSLVSGLQYARSEAATLRQSVYVTASNSTDANNEWGKGWTVWYDKNSNGAMDSGEQLRVVQLACTATTMNQTSSGSAQIVYRPTGFLPETTTNDVKIDVCDDRTGETGREITISITGRPSVNSSFVCS